MSAIELLIGPNKKDLGGFGVSRLLPQAKRRHLGPFVFWDHIGPATFSPGKGIDVRPHPHIGLATVTYLFSGEISHRDSLGFVQSIRPGDVNWMTAGSGIVHSERTGDVPRAEGQVLHGVQSWLALPKEYEETDPAFVHHPKADLPVFDHDGVTVRLIAGTAYGEESPVKVFSPMVYLDAIVEDACEIPLPEEHHELGIHVIEGSAIIDGTEIEPGHLAVLVDGARPQLKASPGTRALILGGAPLDGDRHMWWNFVSSSKDRIEQAKQDWKDGKFAKVPGETEFIPLPDS